MKPVILLCLIAASWARCEEKAFEIAAPTQGKVSLPLQEWQTVWKAASKLEAERPALQPPMNAAVQSILYSARWSDDSLRCEALVRVSSFSKDWQTVPLVGGEWTLEPAEQPRGVALLRHQGHLCALLHETGDFEIKLTLSLPLVDGTGKFSVVPAAAQRFTLTDLPAGRVMTCNGRAPAGKDQLCMLPAAGGEVVLNLEIPKPPEPPPQPSSWAAEAQVLAVFNDGEFNYQARLFLRAENGSGLEATLKLPAGAQVQEVTGDDLAAWRAQRASDGAHRLVLLRWKTADKLDRRVTVRYSLPQSPLAGQWTLISPLVDDKGHSAFVMIPLEGMEFSHASLQKLPASRAPAWIREMAYAPELLMVEGEAAIPLNAKWLPRMEAAKATITQLRATTKLAIDGSVLHELHYAFQHNGPLSWLFELPKDATLLSCKVNETNTRPVQRAERQLEFALSAKGEASTSSTVTLVWHVKGTAWDKVSGQLTLELPKSDLFTHELLWLMELPAEYELAATEGLERTTATGAAKGIAAFKKQLFTSEAPNIELFYQHIDLAQ